MRALPVVVAAASAVVAACSGPPHPAPKAALTLVQQFVTAETTGAYRRADSLVIGCEACAYCTDVSHVTTAVRIAVPVSSADSVVVRVLYSVAGDLYGYGPKLSRFQSKPSVDTVDYAVVNDSAGSLRIRCAHFDESHRGLSRVLPDATTLDDSSSAAWRAAGLPQP